jgi:hypothetical protein
VDDAELVAAVPSASEAPKISSADVADGMDAKSAALSAYDTAGAPSSFVLNREKVRLFYILEMCDFFPARRT